MSVDSRIPEYRSPVTEVASYQLQAYLLSHGHTVETVTIIRERSSGTCNFSISHAHSLTLSFALDVKVLPRALALPNSRQSNSPPLSSSHSFLSSNSHHPHRMGRQPSPRSIKRWKPGRHTTAVGSRLIFRKVQRHTTNALTAPI